LSESGFTGFEDIQDVIRYFICIHPVHPGHPDSDILIPKASDEVISFIHIKVNLSSA
jgi:hypothetical protein